MRVPHTKHKYKDSELITASQLAVACGVSDVSISKAKARGRIDTFENSSGKEMFHREFSVVQYKRSRDRRHVTTPTRAQKAVGMDAATAQAVAHDSAFDNPKALYGLAGFGASLEGVADLGEAFEGRQKLEISKAELVQYQARIAKNKAAEQEGRLVDKTLCYQRAYQIGSEIQEKIMNIYATLGPKIIGRISEAVASMKRIDENGNDVDAEFNIENVQAALKSMEHEVGEMIRNGCFAAIQELAEKTESDILD